MSSSQLDQAADRAGDAVSDATRRSTSGGRSVLEQVRTRAIQMGVAALVIWGLSWALGNAFSTETVLFLFLALVSLSVASNRVGEFSVPFALSMVGVGALIFGFLLPDTFVELLAPLGTALTRLTGVDVGRLDPGRLALFSFSAILVIWTVDIRITSAFRRSSGQPEAANPDTVFRALTRRVERLLDDYIEIGIAAGLLMVAIGANLLGGVGQIGGDVAARAGEAPELVAGLFTWALGYVGLGGQVPVLADLPVVGPVLDVARGIDPVAFAAIAGIVIIAGWFAANSEG